MPPINLVLIGFGNVGRALARLLLAKEADLRQQYGLEFRLTAVLTRAHGLAIAAEGLPVEDLVRGVEAGGRLDEFGRTKPLAQLDQNLRLAQAQVMVEVTPLNPRTGEPALTHVLTALEAGVHVVTANKGPLVYGYKTLRDLAAQNHLHFLFESTVLDGAPVFSLFRETLPVARLLGFRGVLNSTTNFILGELEAGKDFEEAVRAAQALGIAETDPSADVDGWDAAVKVAALATVLMGSPILPSQVRREGIRGITPAMAREARGAGRPIKLVCQARRAASGGLEASVGPESLPWGDPLATVSGTSSVIHFETDMLEGLTLIEHNPGPQTTAYGLLADLIHACRNPAG
ncbi:MAG: homoserine dehydrogenase [Chloroflexi bacterium]|nr:homoserine dehydrogenase [Chloroflexota bacterium]